MNVTNLLERHWPQDQLTLLRTAGARAVELGARAWLVGGPVRDLLLERPNLDMDLAVEGDGTETVIALAQALEAPVLRNHERFGTATIRLPSGRTLDLATTRTESYAGPAALPDVSPASIREDLTRRDFTINALAVDLTPADFGQVLDVAGGLADLSERVLRALHPNSFADDPTRIFRAVRFEQRLGFSIDPETAEWVVHALRSRATATLTGARVRHELVALLREPDGPACIRRLRQLHVLTALATPLPSGRTAEARCRRAQKLVASRGPKGDAPAREDPLFLAWLGALPPESGAAAAEWLMLGGPILRGLAVLSERREAARDAAGRRTPLSEWCGLLRPCDAATVIAIASELPDRAAQTLLQNWDRLQSTRPLLNGRDLIDMGFEPGPEFSTVLDATFAGQLDGQLHTSEAARDFARDHMRRILEAGEGERQRSQRDDTQSTRRR